MKGSTYEVMVGYPHTFGQFIQTCDTMIRLGWSPCGGLAVIQQPGGVSAFYQAFYRTPGPDEETDEPI